MKNALFFRNVNVPVWMFVWDFSCRCMFSCSILWLYVPLGLTFDSCVSGLDPAWVECAAGYCWQGETGLCTPPHKYVCICLISLYIVFTKTNKIKCCILCFVFSFSRQEVTSDGDTPDSCLRSLFSWSFLALWDASSVPWRCTHVYFGI